MKLQKISRFCAAASAAVLCLSSMPAHAATRPLMFRLQPERYYVLASELKKGDAVLHSNVYIDNYVDMTDMVLTLRCDDPLSLENGGFVTDPPYFAKNSAQFFNHTTPEGEPLNRAIWYGPENSDDRHDAGEVADPTAPLLAVDIRIPKETAVGKYTVGFDTDKDYNEESGKSTPRCHIINDELVLTPQYVAAVLTVEPTFTVGDVDNDKMISIDDALSVLQYYTAKDLLHTYVEGTLHEYFRAEYVHSALEAADYDGSGAVDMDDALGILFAYTATILK